MTFHSEDRVRKGAEKLSKSLSTKQQGRLDGFFTVKPKEPSSSPKGKGKGKGKDDAKRGTKRAKVSRFLQSSQMTMLM
jgi:flap endonuclease-1